jgi:hypothetical protein
MRKQKDTIAQANTDFSIAYGQHGSNLQHPGGDKNRQKTDAEKLSIALTINIIGGYAASTPTTIFGCAPFDP